MRTLSHRLGLLAAGTFGALVTALSPASAGTAPAPEAAAPVVLTERAGVPGDASTFLARGDGYAALLRGTGARWSPARAGLPSLEFSFEGADPAAKPVAGAALPGRVLDLRGGAPAVARALLGSVRVPGLYGGVDLVWRTGGADLAYDLHCAAGVDPSVVTLAFPGAAGVSVAADGALLVRVGAGVVRHTAPVAWQVDGSRRLPVAASFVVRGGARAGFAVEGRDPRLPLVIDPVVQFSTYVGGSGDDRVRAVVQDAAGNIHLAGSTASSDFPVRSALQGDAGGGSDAFVMKLSGDGRSVVFATYLGGSGDDEARGIALDASGNVLVAGWTGSTDFPVEGAFQSNFGGERDAFLACLSADGATLLRSSYLGGSGDDRAHALVVDGSDRAWVAGTTASTDFPATWDAWQGDSGGGYDAFAACVSADGSFVERATYLGGSGDDDVLGMAADAGGIVTLAGRTESEDFPLVSALQGSLAGGSDAFLAALNVGSGGVFFSTYFGGSGFDEARAVAADGYGLLFVAGRTDSLDFPLEAPSQGTLGGAADGFFLVLSYDGGQLHHATFLGGSGDDAVNALALEKGGGVVLAGETSSADFPLKAAAQDALSGGSDGFVVRLRKTDYAVAYASYLGGSGEDAVHAVSIDASGVPVVAGSTTSGNFPVLFGLQAVHGGGEDGFAARVLTATAAPAAFQVTEADFDHLTLAWADPSGGRASFEIQCRTGQSPWTTVATPAPGTTSWVDTAVLPDSTYLYRMRSILDGVPSPFSPEIRATTLTIPVPAVPGAPMLTVESPSRIRILWADNSDNEITFEVFRGADGALPTYFRSVSAGVTETVDATASPDRTWTYRVRAVGVSGPSSLSPAASATTEGTLVVEILKAVRKDVAASHRDSLKLTGRITLPAGGEGFDPRARGFSIGVGAEDGPAVLTIAPGAEGWTERNGVFTWRSPKGSVSKARLVVDADTGTVKVAVSRVELPALAGDGLRTWVRTGADAGSHRGAWETKKPGLLLYR